MNRAVAMFVVGLAASALAQQSTDWPVSSQGKAAAAPADITITVEHVAADRGQCAAFERDVCERLEHWRARVHIGAVDAAVVSMTSPEELRRILRVAGVPKLSKESPFVSTATAELRVPACAPWRVVHRLFVAAAEACIVRTGFLVLDANKAEQSLPLPIPENKGGWGGEPLPRKVDVAVFFDRTTRAFVRRVDHKPVPWGADGDREVRELLAKLKKECAQQRIDVQVVLVGDSSVPWQRIVAAVDPCVAEGWPVLAADTRYYHVEPWPYFEGRVSLEENPKLQRAFVDGRGWRRLSLDDFVNVNGKPDTWTESSDGVIYGTGKPIGGARSKEQFTNFELVLEWRHLEFAGNSGVFVWCPESAFKDLPAGQLPRSGIEVQVLDLGYEEQWLKDKGKRSDWFTSHGDVFPVGASRMQPFTPQMTYVLGEEVPFTVGKTDGSRCFPTRRLTKPAGEWNHYYIRAINGEVRLWVNGEEVSGGTKCEPARGYLALEAEGAKVEFRNLRIRELP